MSESSSIRGKKNFFFYQIFVSLLEKTLGDDTENDASEFDQRTDSCTWSLVDMVCVSKFFEQFCFSLSRREES